MNRRGILITGDLLFVGKVGGTTNDDDARTEWASLRRLLDRLPDDATVWPGHDYGVRPSSTIGLERATNPFLRCPDLAPPSLRSSETGRPSSCGSACDSPPDGRGQ